MLIVPSKEFLLITAEQSKQIFLFDPKTTSIITKYHSEPSISKTLAFYPNANQFITAYNNKTFLSIWNTDCQQSINKFSTLEIISFMTISNDKNFLFAGSQNGTLYIWELPTGILIRKSSIHSEQVKKIIDYRSGYLMSCSKKQVKIWKLSSFYIEKQRSSPLKVLPSVLDIIDVEYARNIFMVLTSKSITYYLGGNEYNPFPQLRKEEVEFPTTICTSLSHLYIGNCQGEIYSNEIVASDNSYEIDFTYNSSNEQMTANKLSKRNTLKNQSRHAITYLIHMKTTPYLISGNSNGDVSIWHDHSLKRTLKLFKASIKFIHCLPKPQQGKIPQSLKLRPFSKYEQNNQTQALQVDIQKLRSSQSLNQFILAKQVKIIEQEVQNDLILERMLKVLNSPEELLKNKICQLEREKQQLIKVNLHYAQLFNHDSFEERSNAFDF